MSYISYIMLENLKPDVAVSTWVNWYRLAKLVKLQHFDALRALGIDADVVGASYGPMGGRKNVQNEILVKIKRKGPDLLRFTGAFYQSRDAISCTSLQQAWHYPLIYE